MIIALKDRARRLSQVVRELGAVWQRTYTMSMGAALAFYTVFSLPPLLVLLSAIAGLFVTPDVAQTELMEQLGTLFGAAGAKAIAALVTSGQGSGARSALAAAAGAAALLVGATSVFAELQDDLDRIWNAPPSARPAGLWGLLRTRVLSFGLIVALGFLLVVSLALSAFVEALSSRYRSHFGNWLLTLRVVNFVVGFVATAFVFLLVYKILPSVRIAWRNAAIGAAITTVLFSVGRHLIGLYLGNSHVVSAYGGAGSLLLVLIWIYYSAQVFLLGALCMRAFGVPGEDFPERSAPSAPAHVESGTTQDPHARRGPRASQG
jgi:membrane protein